MEASREGMEAVQIQIASIEVANDKYWYKLRGDEIRQR
jgi:hypothetical protein